MRIVGIFLKNSGTLAREITDNVYGPLCRRTNTRYIKDTRNIPDNELHGSSIKEIRSYGRVHTPMTHRQRMHLRTGTHGTPVYESERSLIVPTKTIDPIESRTLHRTNRQTYFVRTTDQKCGSRIAPFIRNRMPIAAALRQSANTCLKFSAKSRKFSRSFDRVEFSKVLLFLRDIVKNIGLFGK